MENLEARLKQDDFSCIPRDIRRRRDGYTHIRRMQRRGIVDSVTEVANHVAAVFQRVDNPVLLHRRNAREHGAFLGQCWSAGSLICSSSSPRTIVGFSSPTCSQTCRATSSLSPVRIFTCTPSRFSASMDAALSGFGGSANAR